MNIKQKIGLGVITPLFAFAVGHTVLNKINTNKETKTEVLPDITNALEIQDKNAAAVFKAEQNLVKEFQQTTIPFNEYKNVIKNLEQPYSDYDSKEVKDILENCVECGD